MEDCIIAIIVTYYPDLRVLDGLIESITNNVQKIIIVDNSSDINDIKNRYQNTHIYCLSMRGNKGIAAAQNSGISLARQLKATYVLLFDQDSKALPNMIPQLLDSIKLLPDAACVGPRYLDSRQDNPPPFIKLKGLTLHRFKCDKGEKTVPVDYLISSGCLISMPVLNQVGNMREDLFIDYVDIEWGLRARYHGYQSYGVCGALMEHNLGENPINFFGKKIPLHSPLRHYYHFRNAILLYKEDYIPIQWKIVDGFRLLLKYIFYSLFAKPRLSHLRMMTFGVWHGLWGKSGPLQLPQ